LSSDDSTKSAHFRFLVTKGVFVHQRLMQLFREYSTNVYFLNNQTYSLNSLAVNFTVKYSKMSSRKRIAVPLTE
jgi:hypothetical protein